MKNMKLNVTLGPQTRTGRFFRTLLTSFVHLGAATLYSFLLIPLILHFENTEKLGLWLLVAQMGAYLTVVDAGLSALSIRQFVGAASEGDFFRLAPRFQATFLISSLQGLFICLLGFSGWWWAGIFKISGNLENLFCQLFLVQCFLVGISFPFRPFSSLLLAAQRFETNYLASSVFFGIAIFLAWCGFQQGWGLWSLLMGSFFQIIASGITSILKVKSLGDWSPLFSRGTGARRLIPRLLRESAAFANGPVFFVLGGLLQSTVLSRLFGLEGVALWNVGTKIATFFSQVLSKFYESSFGGLSELFERGHSLQMRIRFLTVLIATSAISVLLAACLPLGNGPFIDWWTRGVLAWPVQATWGVSLWLITTTLTKGVAEQTKVLLLWHQIRWGPLLDFIALSAFLSAAFLSPKMPTYALALALAPLGGSFAWNARSLFFHMHIKRS